MTRKFPLLIVLAFFYSAAFAQLREIPKTVMEAFTAQYPKATQSDFEDQLTAVHVHFMSEGAYLTAKYTNKGVWKETEKKYTYDRLSPDVQDGFKKSRYADWKVAETAVVYMPGGFERFRIKVEKSELQKKYLYFEKDGRMIRESIAL